MRCGAVRCDAVRCGAVRCAAVRCGAVRCGAVRCGAVSDSVHKENYIIDCILYNRYHFKNDTSTSGQFLKLKVKVKCPTNVSLLIKYAKIVRSMYPARAHTQINTADTN